MSKSHSNKTGNRCGHDRQHPIVKLVYEVSSSIPKVLQEFCSRVERFNFDRHCLSPLRLAKNSKRLRRSESAESITLVLKCIGKYTDLVTFKVGYYHRNRWINLSYKKIARVTGLSVSRVQRAMSELQRGGFIGVHEIREKVINQHGHEMIISKTAIKNVNLGLFAYFGLASIIERERKKAVKRLRQREEQDRAEAAKEYIPDCAKGLKGFAQAKATMQALKYQMKQQAKQARKAASEPPDIFEWDDGIPY